MDAAPIVLPLIRQASATVGQDQMSEVQRLYEHGEFEMALEGVILELVSADKYPENFDPTEWREAAQKLRLDEGGVFRDDIWKMLNDWIDRKPTG